MKRLKIAKRKTVLDETLRLSWAVEKLNIAAGQKRMREKDFDDCTSYVWSYTTNHNVDSRPYYYLLWKVVDSTQGPKANMVYKAMCDKMIELIEAEDVLKYKEG